MKKILVPIDLSSDYENMVRYASSVASRSEAIITIFYAGGRRVLKNQNQLLFPSMISADQLLNELKSDQIRETVKGIWQTLSNRGIEFEFKFAVSSSVYEIIRETNRGEYELVIMGTHITSGLRGYWRNALAAKVIAEVNTPVFVVPSKGSYNEIEHITYAVDLTDYDPKVIRQVRSIASLFDAKLSIVHINEENTPEDRKETYVRSLEKTISDTIDYPKIYYKFFDHADPLSGIIKFVDQSNSNLLAMINRKKFSWRNLFSKSSFTSQMTSKASVPILAFSKY